GIAAAAAVIAVIVTVVLIMANRDNGTGSGSPSSPSAIPSTPPANTGPFTGTFSAEFGPATKLDGSDPAGTPQQETWNVRSVCEPGGGCVATATRVSGATSQSSALVFDEVAGGWLAVAVSKGTCQSTNAERWEVFSLQPRPGGTFTGEYSSTSPAG